MSYMGSGREGIHPDNQLAKFWVKLDINLFSWPVSEVVFQAMEYVGG